MLQNIAFGTPVVPVLVGQYDQSNSEYTKFSMAKADTLPDVPHKRDAKAQVLIDELKYAFFFIIIIIILIFVNLN